MKKYLMVCLGNICRSPVAEGLLRHHLTEQGKDAIVDSCGTNGYHDGEAPDPRSQANMRANGGDISSLISRRITPHDLDEFDEIFVMDSSNYQKVMSMANTDHQKAKINLILEETHPNQNKAVPDPYYGSGDGFQLVYDLLYAATEKIADRT